MALTLEGHKLSCERSGRVIFSDLSFSIKSGEILHLKGPNGSGKTSLLRLIAGLLPKAGGSLTWTENGAPCPPQSLSFISQPAGIKHNLTVMENLRFWARLFAAKDADTEEALRYFNLEALASTPASYLSLGQRQCLSLTRLLFIPARVWLLDEPFSSLDDQKKELLQDLLRHHLNREGIVIIASHTSDVFDKHLNLKDFQPEISDWRQAWG